LRLGRTWVDGPDISTNRAIPTWNGTDGKLLRDNDNSWIGNTGGLWINQTNQDAVNIEGISNISGFFNTNTHNRLEVAGNGAFHATAALGINISASGIQTGTGILFSGAMNRLVYFNNGVNSANLSPAALKFTNTSSAYSGVVFESSLSGSPTNANFAKWSSGNRTEFQVDSQGNMLIGGSYISPRSALGEFENLTKYSEAINDGVIAGSWTNVNWVITPDQELGPENSPLIADKLDSNGASSQTAILKQSFGTETAANNTFTCSFWAIRTDASASTIRMKITDSTDSDSSSTENIGLIGNENRWEQHTVPHTFGGSATGSPEIWFFNGNANNTGAVWGVSFTNLNRTVGYVPTIDYTVANSRGASFSDDVLISSAKGGSHLNINEGGNQGSKNLVCIRSVSGTEKFCIDSSFNQTNQGKLKIIGHSQFGSGTHSNSANKIVSIKETFTDASLAVKQALHTDLNIEGDINNVIAYGHEITTTIKASSGSGYQSSMGVFNDLTYEHVGGSINLLAGIYSQVVVDGGTVDEAVGVRSMGRQFGGDITDFVHFHAENPYQQNGTITDLYGLRIDKQTIGANNYGIVLDGDGQGSDITFGAGQNSSVYYDSSNLKFEVEGYVGFNVAKSTGNYANVGMGGNASTNDRYINTMSRNVGDVLTMQLANASTVNTSGSKFEIKSGQRSSELIQWEDGYVYVDAYTTGRCVLRNAGTGGGISLATSLGTSLRVYAGGVSVNEKITEFNPTNAEFFYPVQLMAGTTTYAPMNIPPGTAKTTPVEGDIEYVNGHLFFTQKQRLSILLGNGIKTTTTTVENTVTETQVYSYTFAADQLNSDQVIKFVMNGLVSNASASDDYIIRFKAGGTTVHTINRTGGNVSDEAWDITYSGTIRTAGASGEFVDYSTWAEGSLSDRHADITTHSIDTTGTILFEVTVEWNAAKVGNIFKCNQGHLEFLH